MCLLFRMKGLDIGSYLSVCLSVLLSLDLWFSVSLFLKRHGDPIVYDGRKYEYVRKQRPIDFFAFGLRLSDISAILRKTAFYLALTRKPIETKEGRFIIKDK